MKTTTPSAAIAEIMSRGSVDPDGEVRPMRKVELFRKMEAVEPGLPRTKVYDRLKATNPQLRILNSIVAHLGYSVVLVPNERVGRLGDDCYRLVSDGE